VTSWAGWPRSRLLLPSADSFAQEGKPVRIGFSLAKTGIFAAAAPSQLNAYLLWQEQTNAQGGLEIAGQGAARSNSSSTTTRAIRRKRAKILREAHQSGQVDLLLAPWGTSTHIAIAPVVERFKFPVIGNTAASVSLRDLKPRQHLVHDGGVPRPCRQGARRAGQGERRQVGGSPPNVLPFSKEVKRFLEPGLKEAASP